MQTLADFLYWAEDYFNAHNLTFGHGTDNAWDDAVDIALYVLKLAPDIGPEVLTRMLQVSEHEQMIVLAKRRAEEHIPVPYLTHEAWFAGEKYYVDERVIIPRSPFAELIQNKFEPWQGRKPINTILDLCTGSGCIAIACAKAFSNILVDAVDLSADALAVARQNIQQHQLEDRISAIQSDLFQAVHGKTYDIIVSNPPYVSEKEYQCLPKEYQYEPKLALASGLNGFDCTKVILRHAADFLTNNGLLFVEVGNNWQALEKKYPTIPFTWLEFANGGEGVFMLTKEQLAKDF